MSHYTIHQDDDTSTPVHTYRWSLLKDGKKIGELYSQGDAETIRAALNGETFREALAGMVYQFGYDAVKDGQPAIFTGGLSALEDAFEILGWDDPYVIPDPVWCDAPVTPRCANRPTSGTPTADGYKHFCHEHFSFWQAANPSQPTAEQER